MTEDLRYRGRFELYPAYEALIRSTIPESGDAFLAKLKGDSSLRREADLQLILLSKAHTTLRRSFLHRRFVSEWLPHVVVCLWVMLEPYVKLKEGGTIPGDHWFRELVSQALRQLHGRGKGVTLYSSDGMQPVFTIPADTIKAMIEFPELPFRGEWKLLSEPPNKALHPSTVETSLNGCG